MRSTLRIIFGFALACIAAAIVTVLFVDTPLELAELSGIPLLERLTDNGILALKVATHSAIFAAPFAFLACLVAEWAFIRNWLYYAVTGLAIAGLGFALQYSSEVTDQRTILNGHAALAFLMTGFLGGVTYWLFAGRRAGGEAADPVFVYRSETTPPTRDSLESSTGSATSKAKPSSQSPGLRNYSKEKSETTPSEQSRATSVPVAGKTSPDPENA